MHALIEMCQYGIVPFYLVSNTANKVNSLFSSFSLRLDTAEKRILVRKLKQGKVKKFKNRYWLSALASFILGLITTLLIFPKFEITQTCPGIEGLVKLFCTAFGFGFAWNSLVNETAK